MGSPTRKAAGRAGLIAVMLTGGLLSAGISQAQDIGAADAQERAAELVAASGGPASGAHLIAFSAQPAAVDVREDDVAAASPAASSEPDGDASSLQAADRLAPIAPSEGQLARADQPKSKGR